MESQSVTIVKHPNNNNHADNQILINNQSQQTTTLSNNNLAVTAQPFTPASNNNNGNNTNNNNMPVQQTNSTIAPAQSFTPVPAAAAGPIHGVAATPTGHPIYNQAMHSPNMFVPAPGVHQTGPLYAAMMPAQIPSNVYVNNVTANVNLHGWAHTVPTYIPGGAPHYIQGDVPPDQNPAVMQAAPLMPVALAPTNAALVAAGGNGNTTTQVGNTNSRGSRRGRGRGSSGSSRRNDYNNQRHPQPEGSPAPQPQMVQTSEQMGQQQSLTQQQQPQQIDPSGQLMASGPPSYAAQPQYAHPPAYAAYQYQTYFAAQNPMLHPAQAAQQATGTPLYVSHMPMYNAHPVYNYMGSPFVYPPVINPPEYQFVPGEDGQCDERQNPEGMVAPMWHAQPIYADEYGMNPEMHGAGDEMNHNASSMGSGDTPSMLSPNYAIYDPQLHEVQQHMGMMHIYDETQMAQMQGIHAETPVTQLEDDINECGTQPGAIQMVASGALIAAGPIQMSNETQIIHHSHTQHQAQHIMQNTTTVLEIKSRQSSENDNVHVEHNAVDEISDVHTIGSVTSLNELHAHQSVENIVVAEEYQQLPPQHVQQQLPQQQQQLPLTQLPPQALHSQQQHRQVHVQAKQQHQQQIPHHQLQQHHQQQQQLQQHHQHAVDMPVAAVDVYHKSNKQQIDNVPIEEPIEVPVATVAPAHVPTPTPAPVQPAAQHAPPVVQQQQQQQQHQTPTVSAVAAAAQPAPTAAAPAPAPAPTVASVATATTTSVHTQQQQIQTSPPLQKYHHQQQQQQSQQQQQHPKHQQQSYNRYDQQQQQQHHNQQYHHQQNHNYQYEQRRPQQNYNNNQSRRKYDYNNQSSYSSNNNSNNNNNNNSGNTNNDSAIQTTTKTMSWTNSSKKSTASVAVTATPSSNSNNSNNSNSNQNRSYGHTTKTYTNHQHHYQQQSHYQQNQQQQQHGGGSHYSQAPQMRNYSGMKMPSSPIGSNNAPPQFGNANAAERRNSQQEQQSKYANNANSSGSYNNSNYNQYGNNSGNNNSAANSSNSGNAPAATSTASITAMPQHFSQQQHAHTQGTQQQSAGHGAQHAPQQQALAIDSKQYPGFTSSKKAAAAAAAAAIAAATANTNAAAPVPIMNLAPPITANTNTTASSTLSWASLFNDSNNANASTASSTSSASGAAQFTATGSGAASTNATNQNSNVSPALPPPFSSKKPIAKVAPYECIVPAPVNAATPVVLPGAMSYSAASAQGIPPPQVTAKTAVVKAEPVVPTVRANLDEYTLKFAEFLTRTKTDLSTVSLRPRGLTNPSNYCYINSILQALVGCAPFYNLIRSIPRQAAALSEVRTPTVNALISFVSQFSTLPSGMRLRTNKSPKSKDELGSELQCDSAFEPTEIYRLWVDSREEYVEGRQEDAEEFLSYVLNKLNDEMLEVIKLVSKPSAEQNGRNEVSENEDGDEWQMICNNRNKGSVTRQTDFGRTPLSDIFRGELRSRLQREGEHSTDDIQPFFTLQLNIEKAASVKEALEILVGRDQLEGVTGSKTKQEVVAWQQMTLEKLPIILILHLKWFDYRSDGCTKILKKVEFPIDLKIDAKILASKKYSMKQRAYRLFAVVYHDGKEATKGHYITDVYHTGYCSWLRFNDSSVKPVSENEVLYPKTPRVPYLLYYRRCDTMQQQQQQHNTTSSNAGGNAYSNTTGGNHRDGNK